MTVQDWAALILSVLTILAIVAGAIRWMVKHYLAELKPNGGDSIKDTVSRLEKHADDTNMRVHSMEVKLERMYDIILEHFSNRPRD